MLIPWDEESKINAIIERMWKFNHTYTLTIDGGNAEDHEPYWYIRDEFGSAIEHADRANIRMAPFLSMIDGLMYTLLWLIEDIECNGMHYFVRREIIDMLISSVIMIPYKIIQYMN